MIERGFGMSWINRNETKNTRNSSANPLRSLFLCGENCQNHDLGGFMGLMRKQPNTSTAINQRKKRKYQNKYS